MDHDVGGLDIAVDDSFFVRVIERGGGLAENAEDGFLIGRLLSEQHFFERRAVDELHEDVRHAVLFGDVVNGHDAGVRKNAGGLRFADQALAETLAFGGVGEVLKADTLDRDGAADGGVQGLIYDAHRAPPQFRNDLVAPDLLHVSNLILTQRSGCACDRIVAEDYSK